MKKVQLWFAVMLASLFAAPAFAFTTPAAGSFGFAIYDIVIVKMLGGPIGWVGAAALLVWGVSKVMTQWMLTVMCVIGATVLIKVSTILTSLGAVV